MINILIADDNNKLVELIFKSIIRKNNEYRLMDYTYDGENTLKSILKYNPDVILLDINMPKIDGISIIKKIISEEKKKIPYIIIITAFKDKINFFRNNKNIYGIIDKGSGFSNLITEINRYLNNICKELEEENTEYKTKQELANFEFNSSNLGTTYLIDTIKYALEKEKINLEGDIYLKLARKYKVKVMNIKWNIEKSIKSMKRYTDNKTIEKYFNIDNINNLTIKNFITTVSNKIRNSK